MAVSPLPEGDRWIGLTTAELPAAEASAWAVEPRCGAVVTFNGTARDHATGRPEVSKLEYEAYEDQVVPRLAALVDEMRSRWPDLGRVALIHRHGVVPIGEAAVLVVVAAPHRDAAFDAARFGIESIKSAVPIWKRETWRDGESWGLEPQHVIAVDELS